MTNKALVGECLNCDSSYGIQFTKELVSKELPEYCPFCGEVIEDIQEEYINEDDDTEEEGEWD
jgi:hypothetical protein